MNVDNENPGLQTVHISEKYRMSAMKRKKEAEKLTSVEIQRAFGNRNNNGVEKDIETCPDCQTNIFGSPKLHQSTTQPEAKEALGITNFNLRSKTWQQPRCRNYATTLQKSRPSRTKMQ